MSLRVWLPLNGSLENKGLDDITVTNNGATVDDNGKIGKCYSFDGSNDYFIGNPAPLNSQTMEWSYCCWFKPNKLHTGCLFSNRTSVSETGITIFYYNNYIYFDDGVRWSFIPSTAISIENWNHLVFVRKISCKQFYLNGVLINETSTVGTNNNNMNSTHFTIGMSQSNNTTVSGNILNGKLNDVRIYDHALSPLEVKQISQGLVLHYPLNRGGWGQENLLKNSHIKYDNNGYYVGNYVFADSSKLETGKTYTLSFNGELQDDSQTGWYFNIFPSPYTAVISKTTDKEGRFAFSFTMPKNGGNRTSIGCYSMPLGNRLGCAIWNVKLEEGSIATPWCPNSSDALATTMGLNDNVEYDVSGYCNNGEYYAYDTNGSISCTSDTPKYNVSTHIASANPTQNAASGTRYLYGHCELMNPTQMSVAFWLKPITGGYGGTTSNGQGYFCTTNYEYGDTSVGVDYQASAMNHRDNSVNMNDSASTTQCNVTFCPTIGEWHHYVYTYDGQIGRGYKDGVQTATAQFSAAKTLDSFIGVVIGFSKAEGVWRRNDACYSDFRVYATALSAEDVKDLYELGATIDTNGVLSTYEFTEQ